MFFLLRFGVFLMEGKTHALGGRVCSLAGFIVLKESGYLISSETVSPALQFLLLYGTGMYGGIWSDNDQPWSSSPCNDPFSWVQNKVLRAFNKTYRVMNKSMGAKEKRYSLRYKIVKFLACRHRSWQTHSEFTLLVLYVLWCLNLEAVQSEVNLVLKLLMILGFSFGIISHIFLDMLTSEGVPLMIGEFCSIFFPSIRIPKVVHLVPSRPEFDGGSAWELSIRRILRYTQYVLILVIVPYIFGISVPSILYSLLS